MIGETIEQYRITGELGSGGMGKVYSAHDTKLDRPVAIKFMQTENEARRQRFKSEARAASALNHPNICTIYDIGETERDRLYIAMEFISGYTLHERLRLGAMETIEVLNIAVQVTDAIRTAHANGIVHRDIKPANIKINDEGRIKVLDFGLAKRLDHHDNPDFQGTTQLQTIPGQVLGTPGYMSPEQALGKPVDHRTDIFSLGALFYELATGKSLFQGSDFGEALEKTLRDIPPLITKGNYYAPLELDRIVRKCLQKDRDNRYQSSEALLTDLANLKQGVESGSYESEKALPERSEGLSWLTFISFATICVLLAVGYVAWREPIHALIRKIASANSEANQPKRDSHVASMTNRIATPSLRTNTAPSESIGHLAFRIRPLRDRERRFYLYNNTGTLAQQGTLSRVESTRMLTNLPPGNYRLEIQDTKLNRAEMISLNALVSDATTNWLEFDFVRKKRYSITTDPPGAMVIWDERETKTSCTTPEFVALRPGQVRFTIELEDYLPIVTNILITNPPPAMLQTVHINLRASKSPIQGQPWTKNLLGVPMNWLKGEWISQTEITRRQFEEYLNARGHPMAEGMVCVTSQGFEQQSHSWSNPGFQQAPDHPVVGVSWRDAMEFCQWLTNREQSQGILPSNLFYRLPTVAEYRTIMERVSVDFARGNYADPTLMSSDKWNGLWPVIHSDKWPRTAEIIPPLIQRRPLDQDPYTTGTKRDSTRTPYGTFYHLGGNVSELCLDWFTVTLNRSETRRAHAEYFDRDGGGELYKAVHGASWYDHHALDLNPDTIRKIPPSERNDRTGFRLALAIGNEMFNTTNYYSKLLQ